MWSKLPDRAAFILAAILTFLISSRSKGWTLLILEKAFTGSPFVEEHWYYFHNTSYILIKELGEWGRVFAV